MTRRWITTTISEKHKSKDFQHAYLVTNEPLAKLLFWDCLFLALHSVTALNVKSYHLPLMASVPQQCPGLVY